MSPQLHFFKGKLASGICHNFVKKGSPVFVVSLCLNLSGPTWITLKDDT